MDYSKETPEQIQKYNEWMDTLVRREPLTVKMVEWLLRADPDYVVRRLQFAVNYHDDNE